MRLSDYTCTALQLANFWQDVRRDWDKGRIYLPQEDMERFGYSEEELGARESATKPFRDLMAFQVERAQGAVRAGSSISWRSSIGRISGCTSSSSALAGCACWTP